ncbi:MAG: lysophospholipid acyltransferase family protein [Planctomycetota bacterium]
MVELLRIILILSYPILKLIALGLFISFWRIRFFNFRKLKNIDNSILIANHQSFFDPVVICIPLPYIPVFLARKTLFTNAIVRNTSKILADVIFFDRENFSVNLFRNIVNTLKKNRKGTFIFPEGTRSTNGNINPFKKGFAILSKILKRDIHAFYIKGTYKVLGRGEILPHFFTPISIYYLKKFSYNTQFLLLYKEVSDYYRRINERNRER